MSIIQPNADVYIPDGVAFEEALERTTHLSVGAHQDDLEIMAFDGILKCFEQKDAWFTGIVLTNGGGSPRDGAFKDTTDEEMQEIRRKEQQRAADIGKYGAVIQLDYPSSVVKNNSQTGPVDDLEAIIELAQPEVVYLHNPADKHETHVASFPNLDMNSTYHYRIVLKDKNNEEWKSDDSRFNTPAPAATE